MRTPKPRRYLNAQDGCWHVQIVQGETHVTADPNEVVSTVLGSCIAACIRDTEAGVGGMNHFLLPEADPSDSGSLRYGANAMELLINALLRMGAVRKRLEAKLFGGANVLAGISGIGSRNAAFAERYLSDEGIRLVGGDLGGERPRRVQYWPCTGRARQLAMPPHESFAVAQKELQKAGEIRRIVHGGDDVELF